MTSEAWIEKRMKRRQAGLLFGEMEKHCMREFARQGVKLTPTQSLRLRKWLRNGAKGGLSFRSKQVADISLGFTARQMRRILGLSRAGIRKAYMIEVARATEQLTPVLYRTMRRNWPAQDAFEKRNELGFLRRLWRSWGKPLDALAMLVSLSAELGQEINDEARVQTSRRQSLRVDVLTRLHGRACQVSREVLLLLAHGYADGAVARWRCLHEIAVVMIFLMNQDVATLTRYVHHQAVDDWQSAQAYEVNAERMSYARFTPKELRNLEARHDAMILRYNKDFASDYGWAAAALKKVRPSFRDIEAAAALSHWRTEYKAASSNVHAGPKGMYSRLGLLGSDLVLAGASNLGLDTPGQNTAISLMQANAVLLQLGANLDRIITMHAMQRLTEELEVGFQRVASRVSEI